MCTYIFVYVEERGLCENEKDDKDGMYPFMSLIRNNYFSELTLLLL